MLGPVAVKQQLSEAFVGHREKADQNQKSFCWHELQGSNAGEGAGETQLDCVLGAGWGFGRTRRTPEHGSQSTVWEDRPLAVVGKGDTGKVQSLGPGDCSIGGVNVLPVTVGVLSSWISPESMWSAPERPRVSID